MEDISSNFAQRWLRRTNAFFRQKITVNEEYKVDPEQYVINRKNGFAKNFMRLINKTLIGFQRIKVNKTAIFSGLLAMGLGYLASEVEDSLCDISHNYKTNIKSLIVQEVLRNVGLKNELKTALDVNVLHNTDIQSNLSDVLIYKALKPQASDIFELSKKGIIEALNNPVIRKDITDKAAEAVISNKQLLGDLALDFLGSETMDKIIRDNVSQLLTKQQMKEEISNIAKSEVKSTLESDKTRQSLYRLIRQNFVS